VEYPGSEQFARDDTLGVEAAPTTIQLLEMNDYRQ